jgi:hypothetical protein
VGGKLENSTLAVGTSRDDTDIGGVVNRNDDASGENDFLPGEIVNEFPTRPLFN